MFRIKKSYLPYALLLVSGLIAILDQAVKWGTEHSLAYGASVPVTSFFNWVHSWNTGAAFGFLAGSGGWQRYLLIAIAIVISVALTKLICGSQNRAEAFAYCLILGGAMGNLIDRIIRGHVIDYLDFYWLGWHWPAFNLADIAIVLGALLLVRLTFLIGRNPPTAELD